ncbi:MAG: hypothetical protein OEY18_04020 [Candidatus Aminicenantes bacterium]|nr:hypothetical protein [Candidatus Aminicenantes bacterium]MDH5383855.1 hypothetical protein [Candidatus Aminicenantes bacterium]MDH5743825.1 hypothetical protein [Candidatus Aminicenantes bacterium]
MTSFGWICPFCHHSATINSDDYTQERTLLAIPNEEGSRIAITRFIVCPNPKCKQFALDVHLYDTYEQIRGGEREIQKK